MIRQILRNWKWTICLPITIIGIGFFISLPLGNCQWTRFHYLFQCYLMDRGEVLDSESGDGMRVISPPNHNTFTGTWRHWYRNGSNHSLLKSKQGKIYEAKFWFKNGIMREEIYREENTGDTIARRWHENGQLASEGRSRGVRNPIGIHKEWYENGQLKSERNYESTGLTGASTVWTKDGRVISIALYIKGKKDGTQKEFYQSGSKKSEIHYVNGQRHGEFKEWYMSGKPLRSTTFSHDKETGVATTWHENGKKKAEAQFLNGVLHGKCLLWDKNGNLVKHQIWKEGEFLSEKQIP